MTPCTNDGSKSSTKSESWRTTKTAVAVVVVVVKEEEEEKGGTKCGENKNP